MRNNHQNHHHHQIPLVVARENSLYSGIDKTVIDSIPFFRFSSLRGSRRGLECVVCLSQFEDIEILRLLPKCKHAFHIGCIDAWLEKHSSCPLCRVKINPEDIASMTYTDSMRQLSKRAEVTQDSNVELFVQRQDSCRSWRFSFRNSLRKSGKGASKEDELPIQENNDGADEKEDKFMDKHKHKIIVSDVVMKKSWSDLSSSHDHVFLNSEMIGDVSRNRFSSLDSRGNLSTWATEEGGISKIKDEDRRKTGVETKVGKLNRNNSCPTSSAANSSNQEIVLDENDERSTLEISGFSRFKEFNRSNSVRESLVSQSGILKRLWPSSSQRTVRWYGDRDKKSQQSDNMTESLNV